MQDKGRRLPFGRQFLHISRNKACRYGARFPETADTTPDRRDRKDPDTPAIYNPKTGNEKAGIPPGTEFDDLPDDWVCPVCGESKDVFELHK